MTIARIIHRRLEHPSGTVAEWFEMETDHGGKAHRDSDRGFKSEAQARAAAEAAGHEVEPGVVRDW